MHELRKGGSVRDFPGGLRPNWLEIDLDGLAMNVQRMRAHLDAFGARDARMAAVVKAEGYGHGAIPVAETALQSGADLLAVAIADEGLALRSEGFEVPILVLGWTPPELMPAAVRADLGLTVFDVDDARALSRAATAANRTAVVHVKIDTGMFRVGMPVTDSTTAEIAEIASMPGLRLEGIFTHFAVADEDRAYTRHQIRAFMHLCNCLRLAGIQIPMRHLCNSAGILDYPDVAMEMVRPGITMYGVYPSKTVSRSVAVRPFMTWKTRIAQVKQLSPGDTVGYGRAFTATRSQTLATLPVGYADGYPRALSHGVGQVLIRGRRCPIAGRVCMDQTMVLLPDGLTPQPGEEVVLMGSMAGETVDVEELSTILGTIAHEIFTRIGPRVPRMLYRGGRLQGRARLLRYGEALRSVEGSMQ